MSEVTSREALITALVPTTIPDCDVQLPYAGATVFLSEYLFGKSKHVPDLLAIRAIKVEWVTRHRSRRVPEMKDHPNRKFLPSNIYRPNVNPVRDRVSKEFLEKEGYISATEPQEYPAVSPVETLNEKITSLERELSELKSMIPSIGAIRDLLNEVVSAPALSRTSRMNSESSASEDDAPVFIPSVIKDDAVTSSVEIQSSESSTSLDEATAALKSVRKSRKSST
jgi:hypothetical protein